MVAQAYAIHVEKGTVAADRRILEGAGAVYDYIEGAGAEHRTVQVKVLNSGSLLVTVGDLLEWWGSEGWSGAVSARRGARRRRRDRVSAPRSEIDRVDPAAPRCNRHRRG